jgi:hypothetical protein
MAAVVKAAILWAVATIATYLIEELTLPLLELEVANLTLEERRGKYRSWIVLLICILAMFVYLFNVLSFD